MITKTVGKNKAVFLDRDGTLNSPICERTKTDKPYHRPPMTPDEVVLCQGVPEGLTKIKQLGFLLVVVTNQGRIQTGEITKEQLVAINQRVDDLLVKAGAPTIDAWYWCPHKNVAGRGRHCVCGKPAPGMILSACADLSIDPAASFMIGDDVRDMVAGRAAKLRRNYLVISDRFDEHEPMNNEADLVFPTFGDAARAVFLMEAAR